MHHVLYNHSYGIGILLHYCHSSSTCNQSSQNQLYIIPLSAICCPLDFDYTFPNPPGLSLQIRFLRPQASTAIIPLYTYHSSCPVRAGIGMELDSALELTFGILALLSTFLSTYVTWKLTASMRFPLQGKNK